MLRSAATSRGDCGSAVQAVRDRQLTLSQLDQQIGEQSIALELLAGSLSQGWDQMMRETSIFSIMLLRGAAREAPRMRARLDQPVAEVRVAVATLGSNEGVITAYGATEAGPGASHSSDRPAEAIVASVAAPTGTSVGAGQAVVSLLPEPHLASG